MLPYGKQGFIRSTVLDRDIKYFSQAQLNALMLRVKAAERTGYWDGEHGRKRGAHRLTRPREFRALCNVMLWSGARVGEALMLTPLDIDFEVGVVALWTEKRRRNVRRYVPLHRELQVELLELLLDRRMSRDEATPVIRMTRGLAMKYCQQLQQKLGWEVRTHMFRHTFAIRAARAGVPLNVLQKWLGHSSIFNTSIYTDVGGLDTSPWMNLVRPFDIGDPNAHL